MNLEDRLRRAFAQRTEDVEVTPGALFEIQRRVARRRRMPEVRLRPALVLAAAACAAVAVAVSISVTRPDSGPNVQTAAPLASPAESPVVEPTTPAPQPTQTPTPTTAPGDGQITTEPPPPVAPQPSSPATSTPFTGSGTIQEETTTTADATAADVTAADCSAQPERPDETDDPSDWVTVYFACGGVDAVPRLRPATSSDLTTALEVLLGGPDEADSSAGFSGLSGAVGTAVTKTDNMWVTIDLPGGIVEALSVDDSGITAQQLVAQLNATVFQFPEFSVAEYRIDGNCAAFGALLNDSCQIHIREVSTDSREAITDSNVSEASTDSNVSDIKTQTSVLTAHNIGSVSSVILTKPDEQAAEVGPMPEGSRLTSGRATVNGSTWAEVITSTGDSGWVSTKTIVAQPLQIDASAAGAMESLARQLTTGPSLGSANFLPSGLMLRWGAGTSDVVITPTEGIDSNWWHLPLETAPLRNDLSASSLADLLWIYRSDEDAVFTINSPGPLGEPHSDFASLAYVSIFQPTAASLASVSELDPAIAEGSTQEPEWSELPPNLPMPGDEEYFDSNDSEDTKDEEEFKDDELQPELRRAQISVIFDFLLPEAPRIAGIEVIWDRY